MEDTECVQAWLSALEQKLVATLQPSICALVQQVLEAEHSKRLRPAAQAPPVKPPKPSEDDPVVEQQASAPSGDGPSSVVSRSLSRIDVDTGSSWTGQTDHTGVIFRAGEGSEEASPPSAAYGTPHSSFDLHRVTDYLHRRSKGNRRLKKILAGRVVTSPKFEMMGLIVILANVVVLGAQTSAEIGSALEFGTIGPSTVTAFTVLEVAFCSYYLAEVALKLHAYGHVKFFLHHQQVVWNWFDVVLVFVSIGNLLFGTVWDTGKTDLSWMRLLRVLKTVNTVRIVKVLSFFKDLRVIVAAMLGGLRAFFWALAILTILIYVWALVIMQGFSSYLDKFDDVSQVPAGYLDEIRELWGTVADSMLTLFRSVTGGGPWGDTYSLIKNTCGPLYGLLFLVYISFLVLAGLKLLTGIFVNQARDVAKVDRNIAVLEIQEKKKSISDEISDMFTSFDDDDTGRVNAVEFEHHLADARMHAYFQCLDLDPSDPKRLWQTIDFENHGELTHDQFVTRLMRLRKEVRWMHIQTLEKHMEDILQHLSSERLQTV